MRQFFRLPCCLALWGLGNMFATAAEEPSRPAASLHPGDLVAICGDSITEHALYSVFIESYLLMCQPQPALEATQFGWSGETSWGFLTRLDNDVLPFHPNVATICYGMNDGHYRTDGPARLQKYREATTAIVNAFKKSGVRFIVVGAPGVVDRDSYKRYDQAGQNQILSDLSNTAKEVAAREQVTFAPVHEAMIKAMDLAKARYGSAYHVAGLDGIHPAPNGHLIMAYAFLKALKCPGDIGTITIDYATGQAQTDPGQKILRYLDGVLELESSRYPYCFAGDPADPNATSGIIDFIPFNQDLNRYLLVVRHAPAAGLRVTWGPASKVFTPQQLQQGINLAAEFMENPFSAPFATVQAAIKTRQTWEKTAIKGMLHPVLEWNLTFPEEKETMHRLTEKILQKTKDRRLATTQSVLPVKHTLTLTPANGS